MSEMILTVSYTVQGERLCRQIISCLEAGGKTCIHLHKPSGNKWMKQYWGAVSQIVFIGAAGIAVRMAAPYIKDKMTDPGLIVADEKGQYFIPVLSGHIGGANALSIFLAQSFGGKAVLTTATDVQGRFAVDLFAQKQSLLIQQRERIKIISSAILNGEPVGFYSEYHISGAVPKELTPCTKKEQLMRMSYQIAVVNNPKDYEEKEETLFLCPKNLVLGMGCKKGVSVETLYEQVERVLQKVGAGKERIQKLVSIDLKEKEPGLLALADMLQVPFLTYTKETLSQVTAVSRESEFVKSVAGIGNVCERAAIYGSLNGKLLLPKYAQNGVTIAVAEENRGIYFE